MKVFVKEVGKKGEIKDSESNVRGEVCKQYMPDAFIEFVKLRDEVSEPSALVMMVDEDGLSKDLETNFLLSFNSPINPIQKIVGTVIIMSLKRPSEEEEGELDDYEVLDLTDKDIEMINGILSEKYQQPLKAQFKDYDWSSAMFETMSFEEYIKRTYGKQI